MGRPPDTFLEMTIANDASARKLDKRYNRRHIHGQEARNQ